MNITPAELDAEYKKALTQWPFLPDVEETYNLPPFLLFAVGSRETNLRNVVGDGGHGNGVWQLDNRSHTIPSGFNTSVSMQADTAAKMLRALLDRYHGNVRAALVAYNAGSGTADYNLAHGLALDTGTANNNYSADAYARMVWLQQNEETDMTPEQLIETLNSPAGQAAIVKAVEASTIKHFMDWSHKENGSIETFLSGIPGYKPYQTRKGK